MVIFGIECNLLQLAIDFRGGSRHFHRGGAVFFKTFCIKKNQKTLRHNSKAKIAKHGKKKNDKDEIGNIMLKHVFTSL